MLKKRNFFFWPISEIIFSLKIFYLIFYLHFGFWQGQVITFFLSLKTNKFKIQWAILEFNLRFSNSGENTKRLSVLFETERILFETIDHRKTPLNSFFWGFTSYSEGILMSTTPNYHLFNPWYRNHI